jgi:hypothetical protein
MIRFRVKSPVGLSKLTVYRVLTNDDEVKLGEITSFSDNKDYVGEILGLEKSFYGSLARVSVLAEDVGGRWSKQSLDVLRSSAMRDEPVAFPGADGYGRSTTGGRGGQVIEVTTLADNSSKGSLRWAVNQSGPRIIVFKVSGTIRLTSRLNISNGNVTIAGQTAPGDGITLRDYPVRINADNVVLRYLRFRMGDVTNQEDDALQGQNRNGVMIDHCSLSWSTDECGSFYDNRNFTLQWSILSESLRVSVHGKGSHGYGGIWGGKKASFHHNLLAHHDSRNPRFCGSRYSKQPDLEVVDFRNNVVYNWGGNSAYAGEGGKYNLLNNYYRPGPATKSGVASRIFSPNAQDPKETSQQPAGTWGQFWLGGNIMHDNTGVTNDNWLGLQPNTNNGGYPGGDISNITLSGPFAVPEQSITHSASDAYLKVTSYAGASFVRDTVDKRVAKEAYAGTYTYVGSSGKTRGIIDTQNDVGGWPELESLTPPADSDGDGMPDAWEVANGLNPNANDAGTYDLSTNYTNIEVYINSLVEHITKEQLIGGI